MLAKYRQEIDSTCENKTPIDCNNIIIVKYNKLYN